jgi:hypothetical protein
MRYAVGVLLADVLRRIEYAACMRDKACFVVTDSWEAEVRQGEFVWNLACRYAWLLLRLGDLMGTCA